MSNEKPRILLHGTGAIGTIYVYLLLKAGCSVTAVCRSNYSIASISGLTIDSTTYGQNINVRPNVVRTPAEAASSGPFDYVLVTSKVFPDARTAETIAPAVTEGKTTIVLIQNGIDIEAEYAARFPSNPILSCVIYLPVTQISPGRVLMSGPDRLEIGTYPSSATHSHSSADRLISLLTSAGGNATFHPDIQEKRWYKLLLNAPWNPICALTLCRDTAFLTSSAFAENVIRGVLEEVCAIGKKLGYESINEEAVDKSMQYMRTRLGTKGIEPSMLVDVLNNRSLETEVILGNPVRIAKKLGVPVPRMAMLYALTKALDEANQKRKPSCSLDGEDVDTREVRG